MERKTVEATAEVTDLGIFSAIAAAYSVDRGGDRIMFGAFGKTIERWQASARPLPLHWDHSGNPADIIGVVDPGTMREVEDEGLYVEGKLDLEESAVAREAWRLMKSGSVAMSFGYLATEEKSHGDGRDLYELDVFEMTVTPAPLNADTKILSTKAVWSTAYVNDLPDGSFLYIAPGGEKDSEGKTTPRSLRYFPYKDATGKVDLPHLRNALARIPQANLPQSVKDRVAAKAERILSSQSSFTPEDVEAEGDEEPQGQVATQDPLRRQLGRALIEATLPRSSEEDDNDETERA